MNPRLLNALVRRLMAPEGDGGGGGGSGSPPPPPPPPPPPSSHRSPEPEVFSREYVRELREENKTWRLRHEETSGQLKAAQDAAANAAKDADVKVKDAHSAADKRVIRAELKTVALKAGMVDLDGLMLADLSTVKLNDKGEVEGADALIDGLKKAKPYLFGTQSSSSSNTPPGANPPGAKNVKDMTDAEYAAARAAIR